MADIEKWTKEIDTQKWELKKLEKSCRIINLILSNLLFYF